MPNKVSIQIKLTIKKLKSTLTETAKLNKKPQTLCLQAYNFGNQLSGLVIRVSIYPKKKKLKFQ